MEQICSYNAQQKLCLVHIEDLEWSLVWGAHVTLPFRVSSVFIIHTTSN